MLYVVCVWHLANKADFGGWVDRRMDRWMAFLCVIWYIAALVLCVGTILTLIPTYLL